MTSVGWGRSGSWDSLAPLEEEKTAPERQTGRIADFLLFALLPMAELQARGLPISELAMGLAVGLALLRPARVRPNARWLLVLLVALYGLMLMSSQLNEGLDVARRLLHLALYVGVAIVASQGRFHVRALSRGLAVGLVVSASAYYVGYGTGYEGRLAGLMADPNAAGYMLTTLGCIALAGMQTSRFRVPLALVLLGFVWLTYSRTSLLAVALILVWLLIGRRLAGLFGSLLLVGMIWAITNIPTSLQTVGPFSDRSGSDALRRRIVALEQIQIANAPWYGHGPGTSKVDVQGDLFFFHNSYLALQNEGGRPAQVLLLTAGAITLFALIRLAPGLRNPWYEAAIIAVAVCSVNLGEVLLELPAALALGLGSAYARSAQAADPGPAPPTRDPNAVPLAPRL